MVYVSVVCCLRVVSMKSDNCVAKIYDVDVQNGF